MAMDDRGPGGRPAGSFSPSEAALAGLRMLAREPRTWLVWGGLLLVFSLLVSVLTVTTMGPALVRLQALQAQPTRDPAAVLAVMGQMAPCYLGVLVGSLLFYAVAFAAVNRALLRPAPTGFAHLKLGRDELRQLGVLLLLLLLFIGVYIGMVIVAVVIAVAVALATAAAHAGPAAAAGPAVVAVVLVALLVLGTLAFVFTRLSLTSPLAFDTGRIDLGASWRMTRGRFWSLFGAYVLAWLVGLVLFLILTVLGVALGLALGGGVGGAAGLFKPDMSSLSAYFGPVRILHTILSAALAPVMLALGLGAPAGAYSQLQAAGGRPPVSPTAAAPASDLPRFGR